MNHRIVKIFDRNRDGYIDMKELKKVTAMLGTMLTPEEIEEFMAEADKEGTLFMEVSKNILMDFYSGWKRKVGLRRICENASSILNIYTINISTLFSITL